MKARIVHLHKTEADWLKVTKWIPEAGELAIYDPDETYSYSRVKVGDGKTLLQDLPFFVDSAVLTLLEKLRYEEFIDGGRIDLN